MYFTSTPKPIKRSENVLSKTVCQRNKFFIGQLNNACRNAEKASVVQTSRLLKSFEEGHRKNILMKVGIVVADIAPKELVAMKVDMGTPWEKVKRIAR